MVVEGVVVVRGGGCEGVVVVRGGGCEGLAVLVHMLCR